MRKNKEKLYIKLPYPGEARGEGKWVECQTYYERNVLWRRHNQGKVANPLPTQIGGDIPDE